MIYLSFLSLVICDLEVFMNLSFDLNSSRDLSNLKKTVEK